MARTWKVLLWSLFLFVLSVPSAFAWHGGAHSELSDMTSDIFHQVTWVSIAVFVIVEVMLLYFLVRYRKRKGGPERGPDIHGSTRLEVAWTIGPALVMVWLLIISFNGMQATDFADLSDKEDVITVDIIASQFSFSFRMPDGTTGALAQWKGDESEIDGITKLEFRQGTTVVFNVSSTDVIHAFSVYELDLIIDANPGRPTSTHFTARDTGAYLIQCRQFCGVGHGGMAAALVVFDETDPRIGDYFPRGPIGGEEEVGPAEGELAGDEPPADADRTIDITLKDFAIEGIDPTALQPGEKVFFRVKNDGPNAVHNFYIGTYRGDGNEVAGNSETIDPQQSTSFVFDVPADGATFDYWCDISGHAGFGMLVSGSGVATKEPRLPGPDAMVVVLLLAATALYLARRR